MEDQNEKLTGSLRHLLSICNDGKEGYRNAAENVDATELKAILTAYSLQRSEYASDIKSCIRQAGGDPDNEEGGPLGLLHRAWIDIKTVFTSNDNKAVIDACVTGEKAAIEAYDEFLQDPSASAQCRQTVTTQLAGISQSLSNLERLAKSY